MEFLAVATSAEAEQKHFGHGSYCQAYYKCCLALPLLQNLAPSRRRRGADNINIYEVYNCQAAPPHGCRLHEKWGNDEIKRYVVEVTSQLVEVTPQG